MRMLLTLRFHTFDTPRSFYQWDCRILRDRLEHRLWKGPSSRRQVQDMNLWSHVGVKIDDAQLLVLRMPFFFQTNWQLSWDIPEVQSFFWDLARVTGWFGFCSYILWHFRWWLPFTKSTSCRVRRLRRRRWWLWRWWIRRGRLRRRWLRWPFGASELAKHQNDVCQDEKTVIHLVTWRLSAFNGEDSSTFMLSIVTHYYDCIFFVWKSSVLRFQRLWWRWWWVPDAKLESQSSTMLSPGSSIISCFPTLNEAQDMGKTEKTAVSPRCFATQCFAQTSLHVHWFCFNCFINLEAFLSLWLKTNPSCQWQCATDLTSNSLSHAGKGKVRQRPWRKRRRILRSGCFAQD